jgi:hypothetical protein
MKKLRNNKSFTVFIVMLLSLALFATNLTALNSIVSAAEIDDFMDFINSDDDYPDYDDGDPAPSGPSYEEEQQRLMEEAQRQAEEARRAEEEAQRRAEEAARQQAEEEARKAMEEEMARQAEEAKKAQAAEEERRAEEARKAQEQEQAKQKAIEEEAKKAEEEERARAEEAAAKEAKRQAEEQERLAKEAAERARQAEEEAKKAQQEEYTYALRTQIDGGNISQLNLSGNVGDGDAIVFSVVNMGMTDVDLVYGISMATSNIFSFTLVSGSSLLTPGGMDKFQIAYDPAAPAGEYECILYLKDKKDNENKFTKYINVHASIKASPKPTKVLVYPQEIKLAQGGDCEFYAEVKGSDGSYVSQDVTWSVTGAKTSGTYITDTGRLVIGMNETSSSLTVTAASKEAHSVAGTAHVWVQSNSYNVNAYANPVNGGMVTGGGAVAQGGSVTLSAVPNKNFYFDGWYVNGQKVSVATNYTINNVRSNINVIASFQQNYVTVTAVPDNSEAGSVVGGGRVTYGGRTTLSAKAKDGYVFTGWREGDNTISTSSTLELNNLTYDRKIVARFSKTWFNISLSCSPFEGGSVAGQGTYKLGDGAKITAAAAPGYTFQGWKINDQFVSRDLTYYINRVERDYCFTAVFLKNDVTTHTLYAGVATTGGTITPSGTLTVARGTTVTYTITPKSGFAILAVAVDGMQVGAVSSYTFQEVKSDHVIAAAFVQTDAGRKAAEASGETVQQRKVQKIYKEPEKVVVEEEQVVDLEEAASGTAGDDFIEEMDLSEILIPTDEELGITEDIASPVSAPAVDSELLRAMGITMDDVSVMLDNGDKAPIMRAAFYEGSFEANAENQFAPQTNIPDYHTYTREELEQIPDSEILPFLPNFDLVVNELMDKADVYELAEGGTANVNVSITRTDETISAVDKEKLNTYVGQVPLRYFDVTLVKRVGAKVSNIKNLDTPLEIVIEIPDDIFKEGQIYSVLRLHDGEVSVLPDLDDNPKTITFRTDSFSSYAISKQKVTGKQLAIRFAIGALITLTIALVCLGILMYHQVKFLKRRRKRKAASKITEE